MKKIKGKVALLDGRTVNDYNRQFKLPIVTHRPEKWAMVDMESGNVFVAVVPNVSTNDETTFRGANSADKALLKKLFNGRK